jgi:hypothetical protein
MPSVTAVSLASADGSHCPGCDDLPYRSGCKMRSKEEKMHCAIVLD